MSKEDFAALLREYVSAHQRAEPFGVDGFEAVVLVVAADEGWSLEVVDLRSLQPLDYDTWGRVELTTMTREFFMPRLLERDEALRRRPCDGFPWDGVAEVRPFGASTQKIVEGVY